MARKRSPSFAWPQPMYRHSVDGTLASGLSTLSAPSAWSFDSRRLRRQASRRACNSPSVVGVMAGLRGDVAAVAQRVEVRGHAFTPGLPAQLDGRPQDPPDMFVDVQLIDDTLVESTCTEAEVGDGLS